MNSKCYTPGKWTNLSSIDGVFSMSPLDGRGKDAERLYASVLVNTAIKMGVSQFVHASVAGIERNPNPDAPQTLVEYWNDKWEIEELVRNAGFKSWTILRPTWVMENLAQPAAQFMFPELKKGQIYTVLNAETRLDMVAAEDVALKESSAISSVVLKTTRRLRLGLSSLTFFFLYLYYKECSCCHGFRSIWLVLLILQML